MGEKEKEKKPRKPGKKIVILVIVLLIAAAAAGVIATGLLKGDKAVEFKTLSESKIPQDISSQVIPEYRTLERALACVVDGKVYVVVTRGEKPTSGFEVDIDKMKLEEKDGKRNLIVYADFKDPEKEKALAQVITYPVKVAETDLAQLPDEIELRIQYEE
ncbi:protease complex subunit PrcB family protein [bacterium 210820-DFI.6.37]|nr:protease complex subunit PrcB family protein [bacterium 210820-DFI.6.37]